MNPARAAAVATFRAQLAQLLERERACRRCAVHRSVHASGQLVEPCCAAHSRERTILAKAP